ncbi:MAG: tripartite tricarboxylate transporter substrate binding protein, partial [Lachnospiraceae bacterium]|nr:tripartite tricarboxylate transporter substrate binding protein [Lachnospiraceae bacterium]
WKPEGQVTLYCPYGAGGATDLSLRCLAEILSDQTGATVTVLNRTGGGGVVGTTEFGMQPADGYTLGMSCNSFFSTQPFLNDVTYTVDTFYPIIGLNVEPNMLVVKGDAPYNTIEEFVQYFKDHPEEPILYSHSGNAGIGHLGQTFFFNEAGLTNYESVPASSGAEGVTFVLGGHVTCCTTNTTESAALFESGDIKPLAVIAPERVDLPAFKDVPTLAECGYDVTLCIWKFVAMPSGAPQEIYDYWYDQINTAYDDPRWQDFVTNYNFLSNRELTHDVIMERLLPEIEQTHEQLKEAGLAVN